MRGLSLIAFGQLKDARLLLPKHKRSEQLNYRSVVSFNVGGEKTLGLFACFEYQIQFLNTLNPLNSI